MSGWSRGHIDTTRRRSPRPRGAVPGAARPCVRRAVRATVWTAAILLAAAARAWAADPVGVLTEIRPGTGQVLVQRAGESGWTAPRALQALRPGDQVRVTGDGRAAVTLTGGSVQTVSAANSPFTVAAPGGETAAGRARGLVAGVAQFLLGQQKEPTYQALSVRSGGGTPPRILSPRETKLMAGAPSFEWSGPLAARYRVRVTGPAGVLWEQGDLPRKAVTYPSSAPALQPGTRYTWTLETAGQPAQAAAFELLRESEALRVQSSLKELETGAPGEASAATAALLRASVLFQAGCYADARRELSSAVAADPDEPTVRLLLAYVYDRVGLRDLAAQEFDEAEYLATRKP